MCVYSDLAKPKCLLTTPHIRRANSITKFTLSIMWKMTLPMKCYWNIALLQLKLVLFDIKLHFWPFITVLLTLTYLLTLIGICLHIWWSSVLTNNVCMALWPHLTQCALLFLLSRLLLLTLHESSWQIHTDHFDYLLGLQWNTCIHRLWWRVTINLIVYT